MKQPVKPTQLHIHHHRQPLYPNAADHRYYAQRALDIVTAIVSVAGFVSAMAFLITLS